MNQLDEKLFRGPRPKSFKDLQEFGFTTVINLQSGAHEFFNDDEYEKESGADFGIKEVNVECSDIFPPTQGQWIAVFGAVKESPGKVYIHCLHGVDRTGFMCAIYRMRVQGWSFSRAKKEMFEMGFHKVPYLWWLMALWGYR